MTVLPSSTASSPEGLALVCSPDGAVRRVVRATLDGAPIGRSLTDSIDEGSRASCSLFLRGIARGGFTRSTPLRIGMRDVHCFGITSNGEVRIVGVIDPVDGALFAERIASEGLDAGFATLAAEIRRAQSAYELYEELARTNNELVTAQRELARTVAELQRLSAWKTEILGMAAHDLRNPLAANRGYITFLQRDSESFPTSARTLLARLGANSDYMLKLVESVLDFSAIESGLVRLSRQETSLDSIVCDVLATNRVVAEGKQIRIDYDAEELPAMNLDRIKVMEALHNLVGNAVQYSPAGSNVAVRVRRERGEAVIEIEDRGPGIPEKEIPDLFTPFKRLSTAKLGTRRSVGLGLAITRRLIEAHGGTVSVKTALGKGSTFIVRLPLA